MPAYQEYCKKKVKLRCSIGTLSATNKTHNWSTFKCYDSMFNFAFCCIIDEVGKIQNCMDNRHECQKCQKIQIYKQHGFWWGQIKIYDKF